jgi:hypothetical protein
VRSSIIISEPLICLIKLLGLFVESNSFIDSDGLGLIIPFAGKLFRVPKNLWGACYDSAFSKIYSFLNASYMVLPKRLLMFVIKILFYYFISHTFFMSVALLLYSGIILNFK